MVYYTKNSNIDKCTGRILLIYYLIFLFVIMLFVGKVRWHEIFNIQTEFDLFIFDKYQQYNDMF